uniref:AMP-dependent synthetase/ligase domain-containing protein n=1 Tax=Photinus pyralis TaxID=7054 RepID=A0A1Y1K0W4_PHOPY
MNYFVDHFNNAVESFKHNNAVGYWEENIYKSLTYETISDLALAIGDNLCNAIKESDTCVGLYMEKNHYVPSLLISLQKCNLCFIFLDPESLEKNVLLTRKLSIKWIIRYDPKDKYTNFLPTYYTEETNFGSILLTLWKRKLVTPYRDSFTSIAYCIMTSATTGEPKIVKVTHECIASNIKGLRVVFKVTEKDVIYFGTPLTFDPSMVEVFLALTTGCTLVIPPKSRRFMLDVLFPSNKCHGGVTILQIVPSLLLHWNDADIMYLLEKSACRVLAFGGEKFPEEILKRPRSNDLKFFNLYGITEVSCWASTFESQGGGRVTLGDPLPDTLFEVRTDSGEVITDGQGELFVGSYSRICYIDDEDASTITTPVFRATGDLVQIKDGEIFYLGRVNSLIKRLGHKINLFEVQESVLQHTALPNVCIWYEDEYKMILFVEIKEFNEAVKKRIVDKLRVKLLHALPRECFPDHIEIIPSIPLSDHGKVDLVTLKVMYQKLICSDNEQRLVDVFMILWCKYLGLSINSAEKFENCTFFELGGNSITVIQCLSELKCTLDTTKQNDLTTLLFEKTFKECCNFVSHLQAVPYKKLKKTKYVHDTEQLTVEGTDTIELKIAWRYDLEACVDSTPTIVDER